MIADLDIGFPIGKKHIMIYDKLTEDSTSYFHKIKKSIQNLQLKIYTPASFTKNDFHQPNQINFDLLKKTLWLTKDNTHFDFGKPKSGNIRTISIEIKSDTLKLKEFVMEDQSSIKAYVEADVFLSNNKITNLSISKYSGCY